MEKRIGPSFKKVKAQIYKKDKNGFYVYAKPNLCDPNTVVKYISRYLGRPVIALKRIDSYDGEQVTFHYNRHEDGVFVRKTIPVLDFMKLLIQHIPEWNFKMTRYYGIYARHRKSDPPLHKAVLLWSSIFVTPLANKIKIFCADISAAFFPPALNLRTDFVCHARRASKGVL